MPDPILRCKGLSKSYIQGDQQLDILEGIDFSIASGQRCAIVGASGSGKSTLLSILGGLDKPSAGEVFIGGQLLEGLNDADLSRLRNEELGFVYQFHHLLPEFSALENVAMPLMIRGERRKNALAQAAHWLDLVKLSARASHLPSELSGGERQRVAIARALVNKPGCVLMDEPTGALDGATSTKILHLINEVATESSAAFIVVSHDSEVANAMQQVYRLQNGKLTMEGAG